MDAMVGKIVEKFENVSAKKKRVGLLLLAVATFSALLAVVIYLYINRDLSYSHQPILENKELLALAAKSQPNPDIYASSLVKPSNPLFAGLKALQEGKDDIAAEVFGKMAEDGNTDSMLWYGLTNMGAGVYGTASAVEWINKAAQQGNPYAMRRLVPAGETLQNCEWYLGKYCDDAWADKAREAFLQRLRANPDDMLSRYAASMDADRAAEAAKQKYYAPMVKLALKYGQAYEAGELSEVDAAKVVTLLKMAANDNFAPAMYMLSASFSKYLGKEESLFYAEKALMLGYNSIVSIYVEGRRSFDSTGNIDELKSLLPYAYVAKNYFREDRFLMLIKYRLEDNKYMLTSKEESKAKEQAEKIISEITPVIYIDAIYDVEAYH
ncbi:hypothetical protein [Shewanella algae]|uniref:hypothetical protein n=2 Tax=Shewanella algae TaxID=38313 RepID=UPI0031F5618A